MPGFTDSADGNAHEDLWPRLRPLIRVATQMERMLARAAVFGSMGVVLLTIGVARAGVSGPGWILVVFLGLVASMPLTVLWRGIQSFVSLRDVPRQLHGIGRLSESALHEARTILSTPGTNRFVSTLFRVRPVVQELRAIGPAIRGVHVGTPVRLGLLLVSTFAALAVFGVGLVSFAAGLALS